MTGAEQHAQDETQVRHWGERGQVLFDEGGHPADRPVIFYRHFEDGSFVQVTVTSAGDVTVEPGLAYDDPKAQTGELYGQRVHDYETGNVEVLG